MTTPDQIRERLDFGETKEAIDSVLQLTEGSKLRQEAGAISGSFHRLQKEIIAGIIDPESQKRETARIENRIRLLLERFEMYHIKNLKSSFNSFRQEIETHPNKEEINPILDKLNRIDQESQQIDQAKNKEEIDQGVIEKFQSFLKRFEDPESDESKTVRKVKNGFSVVRKLVGVYNMVGPWFGLFPIPIPPKTA